MVAFSYHHSSKPVYDQLISSSENHFCVGPCLIYLFGVLRRFQHCIGHITMGSWKGRRTNTYS